MLYGLMDTVKFTLVSNIMRCIIISCIMRVHMNLHAMYMFVFNSDFRLLHIKACHMLGMNSFVTNIHTHYIITTHVLFVTLVYSLHT